MGHDACLVVRCAIQAKGDLEQVITGALEGGATRRCMFALCHRGGSRTG